jgi:hypothetical protein
VEMSRRTCTPLHNCLAAPAQQSDRNMLLYAHTVRQSDDAVKDAAVRPVGFEVLAIRAPSEHCHDALPPRRKNPLLWCFQILNSQFLFASWLCPLICRPVQCCTLLGRSKSPARFGGIKQAMLIECLNRHRVIVSA